MNVVCAYSVSLFGIILNYIIWLKFSFQIRGLQEIYYIFEKAKNNYFLTVFNEHFVPLLFQTLRI